jgi:hypothetical protein
VRMLQWPVIALSLALLASAAIPASAQTSGASPAAVPTTAAKAVPAGSSLVKVSSCSTQHTNPQGGPGFIAWAGGNPGNGYWPDSYGSTYYQPPSSTAGPVLLIAFTNISNKPIHIIEFGLLSNEILAGEVRDVGTFAPGSEIKHKLGLQLSAILPGSSRCVPLKITYADGTTWRNPRLPPKGHSFNSKIPPKPM